MDTIPNDENRTVRPLQGTHIQTPDQRVRVFISSTINELAEERKAVVEAITQLRQMPIFFESGAHSHPAQELYQAYLGQSHIFVGIYWQSYGWVAPSMNISGLEDEYLLAANKPKLIYVKAPAPRRDERLIGLLDRIRADNTVCYKAFGTIEELRELVATDLAVLLAEHFSLAEVAMDASSRTYMNVVTAHNTLDEYRQRVELDTRFVNLRGIPLPKNRWGHVMPIQVPLDKVYIQLQASAQKPDAHSKEREILKRSEDRARPRLPNTTSTLFANRLNAIGEYLYSELGIDKSRTRSDAIHPEDAVRKYGRLVILGAPGAGKSTLLRYLARKSASDTTGPLPIMVLLREYATRLDKEPDLTIRSFALSEAAEGNNKLQDVLNAEVEQGNVLWLIDGLDEAREWRARTSRLISHLPGQVIVTSRPVGYESTGLEAFAQLDVLPLRPDDASRFLEDWFSILAEQREGDSPERIRKQVAHLREQLRQRPRIELLLRNPLLLTFLAILTEQDPSKELPFERAELYRLYVEELIDSWEAYRFQGSAHGARFSLGPLQLDSARLAALEGFYYLGWYLHSVYFGGLKREGVLAKPIKQEVINALSDYYEANQNWNLDKGNLQALSRATVNFWLEAGVLDLWVVDADEYLFFRHMTFQEYAAAHRLADIWRTTSTKVAWKEVIRPVLHHYAWHETLLLLAGQLDGDDFNNLVRHVLGSRSYLERCLHRDLRLAASIIGQASSPDGNQVYDVTNRLTKLINRHLYSSFGKVELTILCYILGSTVMGSLLASNWFSGVIATLWLFAGLAIGVLIWLLATFFLPEAPKRFLPPPTIIPIGLICALLSGGFLGAPIVWVALWSLPWYGAFVFPGLAKLQGILSLPARIQSSIPDTSLLVEDLAQVRGKRVTDYLIRLLNADDPKTQQDAARALGSTRRDPKLVEPILQCALRSTVSDDAYDALRNIGDEVVIERLAQIMTEGNESHVHKAIEGLGMLGDARAVDLLLSNLNSKDLPSTEVGESFISRTLAIIRAIGRTGDVRAVRHLIKLYNDYEPDKMRQRIREYVENQYAQGNISSTEDLENELIQLWSVEEDMGWLPSLRHAAIEALGKIGDEQVVAILIGALADEGLGWFAYLTFFEVCDAAVQGLARLDSALVLEPLMHLLSDKDSNIGTRARALEVMGYIGGEIVSNILYEALSSRNEARDIRCAAAQALGRTRDHKALPLLIDALHDNEQQYLWGIALTTLGQIADPQAVKPLISFLPRIPHPQYSLRRRAILTLGQIGGSEAVTFLLNASKDINPQVRIAAVEALGLTNDPKAIDAIEHVLRGTSVPSDLRVTAVKALGTIRHPDTVDTLLQSLQHNDPLVVYIWDEGEKVEADARNERKVAAEALMGTISTVSDPNCIHKISRALWWRTTDRYPLGKAAMQALEKAAGQLAVAEMNVHNLVDPSMPDKAKVSLFKR